MRLFLGHDLGTSGVKTALVDVEGRIHGAGMASYTLDRHGAGRAEQAPEDFFAAVATSTREALKAASARPEDIAGVAHAGQMLALVALDRQGRATRPVISWLDARAEDEARALVRRFGGERVLHLLAGGSPTGKDLIAKIAWIARHERDVFARTAAFTDVTGLLVARTTGALVIDETAAGCTGMIDLPSRSWATLLCRLASFPLDKMPRVVRSVDTVGRLTRAAADEFGLAEGTPVVAGMADIPAAAVGSGAVRPSDGHLYLGTSSWIGVSLDRPKAVPKAGIAAVPSADPRGYLLIGESETAGVCRDFVRDTLGLDDEGFEAEARRAPAGCDGLLFLPYLYGERSPVPDASLRGGYVGLSLGHDRGSMTRAVYEGTAHNLRWILEACATVGERNPTLRVIGGGARSDLWLQILADVTGRPMERVREPRLAGAVGAALVAAVGTGALPSVASIRERVAVDSTFRPDASVRARYDRAYDAFRGLVPALSAASRTLAGR